ncbi:hypothetical protein TorRG33x02_146840 [Trema orientale]|uniref:Uncharacterized protein n=1 Tax=Trema orientale TaxID=63057 RepID=A0A2P5EVH6_TREOI|nr:hypothetical protein TorRG33x02_146840 [Trema orientale]
MRGKQTSSTSGSSHRGVISLGEHPKNQQRQDSTTQKSSYLISITIPQPKIRIKIPKLVANTMRKPFYYGERSNCKDESPKTKTKTKTTSFSKPRKLLFSTKVGSIFNGVFFRNKKQQHNPPGDTTSSRRRSSTDNCLDSENPEEFSRENSGSTVKEEERKKRWNAPTMACKLTRKVLLPVSKKKVGVGNGNGVSSCVMVTGRRGRSGKLTRVSCRAVQSRGSLRKLRVEKLVTEERDGTGSGVELCKKRILMGGKCKPLNISGTLQYDQNGILRPDPEPEVLP